MSSPRVLLFSKVFMFILLIYWSDCDGSPSLLMGYYVIYGKCCAKIPTNLS